VADLHAPTDGFYGCVAAVLGILAWDGYALATTPPQKPSEEIEKEVQKALEEIEKTTDAQYNP